jgi:hypothetical protein
MNKVKETPVIFVKLDEFERKMTIENYDDVVCLMRSLYNREFELVRSLPNIPNHEEKIVAYAKKDIGLQPVAKLQPILRSKEIIPLDEVEFFWTLGLSADSYIAFINLTSIGDVHKAISNPFQVFKSFSQLASKRAIVIHTHPSTINKVEPSEADIKFTKSLLYMAEHASINLEDHIILGKTSQYSFLQNDILDRLKIELKCEEMGIVKAVGTFQKELAKRDKEINKKDKELAKEREQRIEQDRKIAELLEIVNKLNGQKSTL